MGKVLDLRLAEILMHRHLDEAQQQAEERAMLRQSGQEHQGWLERQCCWLGWQLGCALVRIGARLARYDALPLFPSEGELDRRSVS